MRSCSPFYRLKHIMFSSITDTCMRTFRPIPVSQHPIADPHSYYTHSGYCCNRSASISHRNNNYTPWLWERITTDHIEKRRQDSINEPFAYLQYMLQVTQLFCRFGIICSLCSKVQTSVSNISTVRHSADLPKMFCVLLHRHSRKTVTDYCRICLISANNLWHVCTVLWFAKERENENFTYLTIPWRNAPAYTQQPTQVLHELQTYHRSCSGLEMPTEQSIEIPYKGHPSIEVLCQWTHTR